MIQEAIAVCALNVLHMVLWILWLASCELSLQMLEDAIYHLLYVNCIYLNVFYFSLTLPRVPKLFQPSVACPNRLHPNDEDFNFCQKCCYQRKRSHQDSGGGKSLRFSVHESEIASRVNELRVTRSSLRYSKQKTALEL